MQPGETVHYEFFYEPGKAQVHPSLGNLAFLLEPDGLKLHWMTDALADDWSGLSADNAVAHPKGRRAEKLPLKAGAWNAVTLTVTAVGVKIALNGETIYESNLEPAIERAFGFFYYGSRGGDRRAAGGAQRAMVQERLALGWRSALTTAPARPRQAKVGRPLIGERITLLKQRKFLLVLGSCLPEERYQARSPNGCSRPKTAPFSSLVAPRSRSMFWALSIKKPNLPASVYPGRPFGFPLPGDDCRCQGSRPACRIARERVQRTPAQLRMMTPPNAPRPHVCARCGRTWRRSRGRPGPS